jgi:hypothetical protein
MISVDTPGPSLASATPHERLLGADVQGWSALPLLAPAQAARGCWLFLRSSGASLAIGPLAAARVVRIGLDHRAAWPFREGSLSGVVIDGDALVGVADEALAEARRVTAASGCVLVICGDRMVPAAWRDWHRLGRPPAGVWQRAMDAHGSSRTEGWCALDGDRVTELMENDGSTRRVPARAVFRLLTPDGSDLRTLLQSIVQEAGGRAGGPLAVERVAVRKIGKTAVFVRDHQGRRSIIRVARSPIALSRARRNYDALAAIHTGGTSSAQVVPLPLMQGTGAAFPYFVETCLGGTAGPTGSETAWERDAARYVLELHAATAQITPIDQEMDRLVVRPIERVARGCGSDRALRVLDHLQRRCVGQLGGRSLPLVRTHGDFTTSNCLFDRSGRLTAVVDWELSEAQGLPLLDLLQLMPVAEDGASRRWARCNAWFDLWHDTRTACADPVIGQYVEMLGLHEDAIAILLLMQWVLHVAERIEVRSDDRAWMRMRVEQPLERLERMLS